MASCSPEPATGDSPSGLAARGGRLFGRQLAVDEVDIDASRPSSTKKSTVASRSSTTMPMLSIRLTAMDPAYALAALGRHELERLARMDVAAISPPRALNRGGA